MAPLPPRPDAPLKLVAAGDTHIGLRDHNEDTVLLRRDLDLFVLADGAGGDNAGSVASAMATASIAHFFEETQDRDEPEFDELGLPMAARRLAAAVQGANAEISELARAQDKYRGMGTTVMAVYMLPHRGVVHIAYVGDSRCYRMRDGKLDLLTSDHSLQNDVLELAPSMEPERTAKLPRNVVTRALGMQPTVRVSVTSHELYPGDRYLLCSDGLSDELDDEQIADALLQGNDPEAQVRLLLDVVNAAGAEDNVAAIVVDCRLKPGASDVPRPAPLRGRPESQNRRASLKRSPDASDAEIVIVDYGEEEGEEASEQAAGSEQAEGEAADRSDPEIHVMPEGSADEEGLEAMHELVDQLPPSAFSEREATIRFSRRCPQCGTPFEGARDACPNCWSE